MFELKLQSIERIPRDISIQHVPAKEVVASQARHLITHLYTAPLPDGIDIAGFVVGKENKDIRGTG